jgi:hypothetical protein
MLKPGDVRIRSITIGMWHISPKPLPWCRRVRSPCSLPMRCIQLPRALLPVPVHLLRPGIFFHKLLTWVISVKCQVNRKLPILACRSYIFVCLLTIVAQFSGGFWIYSTLTSVGRWKPRLSTSSLPNCYLRSRLFTDRVCKKF